MGLRSAFKRAAILFLSELRCISPEAMRGSYATGRGMSTDALSVLRLGAANIRDWQHAIPVCGQFQSKGQRVFSLARGMDVSERVRILGQCSHDSNITMDRIPK